MDAILPPYPVLINMTSPGAYGAADHQDVPVGTHGGNQGIALLRGHDSALDVLRQGEDGDRLLADRKGRCGHDRGELAGKAATV